MFGRPQSYYMFRRPLGGILLFFWEPERSLLCFEDLTKVFLGFRLFIFRKPFKTILCLEDLMEEFYV